MIEIYENEQNETAITYQLQLKMKKKRNLVYSKQQFFAQVKQAINILAKDQNVFLLTNHYNQTKCYPSGKVIRFSRNAAVGNLAGNLCY